MNQKRLLLIAFFILVTLGSLFSYNVELIGDRQSGRVKHWINDEFGLIVTDDNGNPVKDAEVSFEVNSGKGEVKYATVTTNEEGKATNLFKFDKKMQDYKVTAKVLLKDELLSHVFKFTGFDYKNIMFYILGGLGLFLFGIKMASDALRLLAGERLKKILETITKNSVFGVALGTIITALLQSSSATTVMTLGFINAGLISLRQAISITMGANIGTTITAQIIAFKIKDLALPAIAIGAALVIFSKTKRTKAWGNIILGFGLLFFGLNTMTGVVKPLRSSVFLQDAFVTLSHNHLLAIFAGTVMTVLVQSSSATVGVTIALASSGLIDLPAALGLVLGDNIGTTITAVLASLGSNTNAKRTALVHVLFNTLGAAYIMVILYVFEGQIVTLMQMISNDIARQIANFHSIFNIFNTIIFLPLIPLLEKIVVRLLPQREVAKSTISKYLSPSLLNEPPLAIDQTKLELGRMLHTVKLTTKQALESLNNGTQIKIDEVFELEDKTDLFQIEITNYIMKLSQRDLTLDQAKRIPVLLHVVNDFEKAADFAKNIAELSQKKIKKSLTFTNEQKDIIAKVSEEIILMYRELLVAFENNDQMKARSVANIEEKLNRMDRDYKKQMMRALNNGDSAPEVIMTMDVISNVEKIADHLYNVAQAVLGTLSSDEKTLYSDYLLEKYQ